MQQHVAIHHYVVLDYQYVLVHTINNNYAALIDQNAYPHACQQQHLDDNLLSTV